MVTSRPSRAANPGGEERTTNTCDTCAKRTTCTRDTGIIFGGCNIEYVPAPTATVK